MAANFLLVIFWLERLGKLTAAFLKTVPFSCTSKLSSSSR